MPKVLNPGLSSETEVQKALPGRHRIKDIPGLGLWLYVSPKLERRWIFRYSRGRIHGAPPGVTEMSLGRYPFVDLKEAIKNARHFRDHVEHGQDPQEFKKLDKLEGTKFKEVAKEWIEENKLARSESWLRNVEHFLFVVAEALADELPIRIKPKMIREALRGTTPGQARKSAATIKRVLDYAKVNGIPLGENPAQWRGKLEHVFPKMRKRGSKKHFPGMPHQDVPAFIQKLCQRQERSVGAVALELAILTACRTDEIIGAQWSEINGDVWTIPAERMKAGNEHRVPLSPQAMALLKEREKYRNGPHVFTGRSNEPLNDRGLRYVMHRMGYCNIATVHGFRGAFRKWCKVNKFDFVASEYCLAHTVGNKVARAYLDGEDLLDERREIMNAWADFISPPKPKLALVG
jgi:integrase